MEPKNKKKIVVIGIAVVSAIAVWLLLSHFLKPKDENVILLSGNVEVTEVDAGFKIPGRITELLTDEGYNVQKGTKLAVLESSELESQVAQNRAMLSEANARLEEYKTGSRPQEIAQAAANLKAAEAELVKAKKDFDRIQRLYKEEAVSAQQFDATKSLYESKAEQVNAARSQLNLVKEGPRKEVIKAAQDRVKQAQAALRVSEERFGDAVLYSPVAGVVLKKNIEQGEVVQAGTPVFTIGDLDNPWIKVYVPETKKGLIKYGQKAGITVDSYPGKVYEGTVGYISSEAEFTPKTVQTQEERVKLVYGVKVRLKNPNLELKPGMPADVKIHVR